jgi:hypothetical protein
MLGLIPPAKNTRTGRSALAAPTGGSGGGGGDGGPPRLLSCSKMEV